MSQKGLELQRNTPLNKKIAEYNDTPFLYGKRLKALIIVGYDKEKRTTEFYRVECYHKRHEITVERR